MSYLLSLLLLSSLACFYGFSVSRGKSCAIGSSALRMSAEFALLFDCDGVIVETEELHRLAYNKAFAKFGLTLNEESVEWTVAYYDILQNTVGGGKPKMKHYFNTEKGQWPASASPLIAAYETAEERDRLVDELQDAKTEYYKEIVGSVATARPGVLELMDEALADPRIKVGICSAATKAGFEKIVDAIVGKERLAKLDVIMAGDDVKEKKPDPLIYNMAREKIGIAADKCVVIEDSMVGLRAAKAASMRCLITYTPNTQGEDFYAEGADAAVPDLGSVGLADIFEPLRAGSEELLEGKRDARRALVVAVAVAAYMGWTPHFATLSKAAV